ncbi:hypothetical protein B0H19DRAFT_1385810 [Mycena capillaripes]|nr:hypothetical protein B0H19DRAFT_1385810 [Mycena capillaripes]
MRNPRPARVSIAHHTACYSPPPPLPPPLPRRPVSPAPRAPTRLLSHHTMSRAALRHCAHAYLPPRSPPPSSECERCDASCAGETQRYAPPAAYALAVVLAPSGLRPCRSDLDSSSSRRGMPSATHARPSLRRALPLSHAPSLCTAPSAAHRIANDRFFARRSQLKDRMRGGGPRAGGKLCIPRSILCTFPLRFVSMPFEACGVSSTVNRSDSTR